MKNFIHVKIISDNTSGTEQIYVLCNENIPRAASGDIFYLRPLSLLRLGFAAAISEAALLQCSL